MYKSIKEYFLLNRIFKETFSRFPIVYLFVTLGTVLALFLSHKIHFLVKESLENLTIISYLLAIFALSLKLFSESINSSKSKQIFLSIFFSTTIAITVCILNTAIPFLFLSLAFGVFYAAFLKKDTSNEDFFFFSMETLFAIAFALVSSTILSIGLSIIYSSISYLFEIDIPSYVSKDTMIIVFSFFFPILILSNLGKKFENIYTELRFAKAFYFIVKNILLPLLFIYALILYSYFVKIIFETSLPKGNLSWMIIFFSSIGIATKFLCFGIKNKDSFTVRFFENHFFKFLLIPIFFLYFAIIVRINEYGFTDSRVAVLMFAFWLTYITFSSLVLKEKFQLKQLVISLSILSFLSISSTYISANSQMKRFESFLENAKLLENGKIKKADENISIDSRIEISSISSYLIRNDISKGKILSYFNEEVKIESSTDLLELLNIKYANKWDLKYKNRVDFDFPRSFVNVKGFSYLLKYETYMNKKEIPYLEKNQSKTIKLNQTNSSFDIVFDDEIISFDLLKYLSDLKKNNIKVVNQENINLSILEKRTKKRVVRLLIQDLVEIKDEKNIARIDFLSCYVLVK